jgi:uncharacterized membrane protein YhhN
VDFAITYDHQTFYLCALIAVSAAVTVVSAIGRWRTGIYLFKPLTTALVIALAWSQPSTVHLYRPLVVAGLLFSLAGDVFLMLPRERFVAGLVAFLVAHLLYAGAFTGDGFRLTIAILLPFIAYGAGLLRILLPKVERALKIPVVVYAAALLVMAWQATERGASGLPGGLFAATGALLFVASDSMLAIDRFARRFRAAEPLVLATYFAAQTLIALSIP